MKRFGRSTILTVLDRCVQEFMADDSAPKFVSFSFKGHYVEASFAWCSSRCCYYVNSFVVVYSNSTLIYSCGLDYCFSDALIEPFYSYI